ncbi:TetR/AcrR family transcriptional regulator [Nonomuraea roseoviolacea]|uniref:AcrR family transcriptional regulator n=1 Tax=Nonomuraea roseoviolacea subsp. carminata TaxID=160689 RepID=A0ABT1JRJ6_9ACTN|nr:TetR/AcrR family transcriptional regulator [Nonomuraea roseoviolacea]MCP2344368.1 AcrR family transcriptional regulator [Nonomuraea roseoviolacea subsp. carminata]
MAGIRERKKQRTRRALIEAALRLFAEKGYEETTLAEIAAEADVSTRTFFSYFASKEDVLLHDIQTRMERTIAIVATHAPDEPLSDLLMRIVRDALGQVADDEDYDAEKARVRIRLVTTVPGLQARALRIMFANQLRLVQALEEAYRGRLGMVEAAAAVGALAGAAKLAIVASVERGDSMEEALAAALRAAEISVRGLGSLT